MVLDNKGHFLYIECMTNEFITSDLHFGHKNILKFCPKTRPFHSVDEMDEFMIKEWNRIVPGDGTVYILGDVSYREPIHTAKIFGRLNGKKILIRGNHDDKALKSSFFTECFEEIHSYLEITRNKTKIIMFHYPICEWNAMHRGSVHFYGHLHGSRSGLEEFRAVDVGMDATGKVVTRLEDALNHALTGKIKPHHGD